MGRMPNDQNPPGGISTRLVSLAADSADPAGINDYDSFAEAYAASNETNLLNAYYERPAMLALAGDVAGRRILDAGCGSGPLFAALRDRGAIVTGIDKSARMVGWPGGGSVTKRTCRWPSWAARFPSPTTPSTTSSLPWYCITWRTGGRPSPSCGACSSPADGSSCPLTIPLR